MKRLIKHILKEEIKSQKLKGYLDFIVKEYINSLYIDKSRHSNYMSFGTVGELWEMGEYNNELEDLIHDERHFRKFGWDYVVDRENQYDEGYYFRVETPEEHYDYQEFSLEVVYDWLDQLVKDGDLLYDEDLGAYGEWVIVNKTIIVKSKINTDLKMLLYYNPLGKYYYKGHTYFDTSQRISLMRDLSEHYGITSLDEMDYIMSGFDGLLNEKIKELIKNDTSKNTHLNESIVDDFINFGKDELSLGDDFRVNLTDNGDDIETLANYDIKNGEINILVKDRAIPDIIRSIAHEMVHHRQNSRGDLRGTPEEGEDGSPWEDEANAKAGELVRIFGKQKPEIYDL